MSSETAKFAFLFPGQGAQSVGMGVTVCAQVPAARALFDRASPILGYDLYRLCAEGPATKLDTTDHSQPALFVASLAALEQLKRDSPEVVENCSAAAGLSLGEYTALVFAGVMDFETGLAVVQERGRAMQAAADAVPSGMVSILGLERDPEFLERCRSIGVRAIPSDFNDPADPALRFACSQGWDVVLIIDSMVYWRYPAVVLAALQDRCKRIYVTVNNAAHLRSRLELLAGKIAERPNMRGDAFSTDWYANRWSVRGFQAWGEALGYATRPLARRSVSAKYLPLWVLPGVFARSVLFELTPQGSSHADQGN